MHTVMVRVDTILPGDNDRTQFDPQDIAALAGSIEQRGGLIEPDENLHRADLDPLDEAAAYAKRMAKYGWTVKDLAGRHRVSETRIRERLALLHLREDIQHLVRTGHLPLKYALAMRDLDNNFQLIALRYFQRTKRPDVGEFRGLCSDLLQKQNQASLWDMESLLSLPEDREQAWFDCGPVDWAWGGVVMFV